MKTAEGIGGYLIQKLYLHGIRHVLDVPADYVLGFYFMIYQVIVNLKS